MSKSVVINVCMRARQSKLLSTVVVHVRLNVKFSQILVERGLWMDSHLQQIQPTA